jgi:carbohydrate kinase (thermoresistant glucokinase family)
MGVSGSGKTTVGKLLAKELHMGFYDADDFHPQSNVEKMRSNQALTDEDRFPWLQLLAKNIGKWASEKNGCVLACSALKESYRQILSSNNEAIYWVFLNGKPQVIQSRIESRSAHFMKSDLLKSQFETLEIPEYGFHVSIDQPLELVIQNILFNIKTNA